MELGSGGSSWSRRILYTDFDDFSMFFSSDSEVTLDIFAVHFSTSFRHEIRWCFGVAKPCGQGLRAEVWSLAFRHERGVGRGSELKLGAWQWQQQLEQENTDFNDFSIFFLENQKSR